MATIKNYLTTAWTWVYDRTPLWIILLFGYATFMGVLNESTQASRTNQETINCKTSCTPSASEYLSQKEFDKCWCYKDKNTLIRLQDVTSTAN